jgi:hypothetical protein
VIFGIDHATRLWIRELVKEVSNAMAGVTVIVCIAWVIVTVIVCIAWVIVTLVGR